MNIETSQPGQSSGAAYTTKTVTTGILDASGGADSEDFNITGVPNLGIIDYISVEQLNDDGSVGNADNASDQLKINLYNKDDFATAQIGLIGNAFSSYTMSASEVAANTIKGLRQSVGGSYLPVPASYFDEDNTGELHLRVVNADFADTAKFRITIKIKEII